MPAATRPTRSWVGPIQVPASPSDRPLRSATARSVMRSAKHGRAVQRELENPMAANIGDCDLLVIGSGAGGLSAAVTAASLGLDVVLIEKEAQLGGTTAWSGGWMWIPRN